MDITVTANVLFKIAGVFAAKNPDMTIRALLALSVVARDPGNGPTDYCAQLGMPLNTGARLLRDMTKYPSRRKNAKGERLPGLDLIKDQPDPFDHRQLHYYLTPKGLALFDALEEAMRARKWVKRTAAPLEPLKRPGKPPKVKAA